MNPTYMIVAVVVIVVVMGAILGPVFARRRRRDRLQNTFGTEYNRTVEAAGSENIAQQQLDSRRERVEASNIRPLSADERTRYQADWDAAQSKFVDKPGEATREADRLITEVMQLRNYPSSSFEERAADISVQYPDLVGDYRAAGAIAVKNGQRNIDTEELRKSMIYYRAVFDRLLEAETVA
jgi:hypothetical protein